MRSKSVVAGILLVALAMSVALIAVITTAPSVSSNVVETPEELYETEEDLPQLEQLDEDEDDDDEEAEDDDDSSTHKNQLAESSDDDDDSADDSDDDEDSDADEAPTTEMLEDDGDDEVEADDDDDEDEDDEDEDADENDGMTELAETEADAKPDNTMSLHDITERYHDSKGNAPEDPAVAEKEIEEYKQQFLDLYKKTHEVLEHMSAELLDKTKKENEEKAAKILAGFPDGETAAKAA